MERRDVLKAGIGGAGLTLTQASGAHSEPTTGSTAPGSKHTEADVVSVVVIGADRSVPDKPIVDKYIGAKADVWFYLPNLPEFSADLEFLDGDPRIKLAKSYADILANKKAGKLSMGRGSLRRSAFTGAVRMLNLTVSLPAPPSSVTAPWPPLSTQQREITSISLKSCSAAFPVRGSSNPSQHAANSSNPTSRGVTLHTNR